MNDTQRPTWCEIDLSISNITIWLLTHMSAAAKSCLLKADAYGHGHRQVAQRLRELNAPCLGVAYVEEGIALRKADITLPIHVLGGAVERQIPLFLEHDLTFTAPSVDKLHQIDEAAQSAKTEAKVHLKIDTGMERIGVHHYNADNLLQAALNCRSIKVEGILATLLSADAPDLQFADRSSNASRSPRFLSSARLTNASKTHSELVRDPRAARSPP